MAYIPKLGNTAYFDKLSKSGEKKCLIRQKNTPKIGAPGPTSSFFFEVVLFNKDESCTGQLFMSILF